jgi:GNAT superfamily N-acetyltransferase
MTPAARAGGVVVRPMARPDIPELLRMMRALVAFERGTDFRLDEAELLRRGFGERPEFGVFVAEREADGIVGFAAHYEIPFMHSLQPLLMMKWLFVDETQRGGRVGAQLLQRMAEHAKSTGHQKFCWFVLKDNARAQNFYRSHGATPDAEWDRWEMRLDT